MKNYALKTPMDKNQLDTLTDALVNAMRYNDPSVMYPNVEAAKPNDGVEPEWFYPIYMGTNDFSELTAIHMYAGQETKFEKIGELMLGIGMTEMKHFGKIGEFIHAIGGTIDQGYDNSGVDLGETDEDALRVASEGEKKTIAFYDKLRKRIEEVEETETTKIALQLVAKLRADEVIHLNLLTDKLQKKESWK